VRERERGREYREGKRRKKEREERGVGGEIDREGALLLNPLSADTPRLFFEFLRFFC